MSAKSNTMYTLVFSLVLCCLYTQSINASWDFAVTTKSRILFYDEQWHQVDMAGHQFDELSALTFDETEEIIYFNDRLHNNGSIFSLRLSNSHDPNDPHILEKVVHRTQNESINGITYDPLNRNLFWTDGLNKKIYFISIDAVETQPPKVLIDFSNDTTIPFGIAIDICRRKLYFTNSNFTNATVEQIDLDGTNRKILIQKNLHFPRGIVVDQLSDRIYYVVDQQGVFFSVETAKLDGTDRQVLVKDVNRIPWNLAVTKDAIYWTDSTHNAVWSHLKEADAENITNNDSEQLETMELKNILLLKNPPRGIVARSQFLTKMSNDEHCKDVVGKIKSRLLNAKPIKEINEEEEKFEREHCLNGGEYVRKRGNCICKIGFVGSRCEKDECHNYCVHGQCSMSPEGFPRCTCQLKAYGERCQSLKCLTYCFNGGKCKTDDDGEPSCECTENFVGPRCEQNSTEICSLFCRITKYEPEAYVPSQCIGICEELSQRSEDGEMYAIPKFSHLETCPNTSLTLSSPVISIIVCGVVISLLLVVLIIHGLRRFYKPARPRIKKTFVVRKQAAVGGSDTPLTNRPIATEQCEITIENCCNMNICDTPCFDPKLVQQTLSRENNAKDDKKMLIHHMEDELY